MEARAETADGTVEGAGGPRGRRIAFRVLAGIFAAGALGGLFGFAVVIAWVDNADGGVHRVHDMGYGALYGAILTTAFVVQIRRPERQISALYSIAAVAIASGVAGMLAPSGWALLALPIVVAFVILLILHPHRSAVLRPARDGFSIPLAALTAAAAIPLIWYALDMAALQRSGVPGDPHVDQGHWGAMAAMAIGIVLAGFLSALKLRGWRITAWSVGVASLLYGLISLVYPQHPGAEGRGWGAIAIAWGVAFIAASELEARRRAST